MKNQLIRITEERTHAGAEKRFLNTCGIMPGGSIKHQRMLEQGLITEEEYCRIDTKNRAKFQPVTGTLLSGKSLLFKENRGNMLAGKEAQSFENGNKD